MLTAKSMDEICWVKLSKKKRGVRVSTNETGLEDMSKIYKNKEKRLPQPPPRNNMRKTSMV